MNKKMQALVLLLAVGLTATGSRALASTAANEEAPKVPAKETPKPNGASGEKLPSEETRATPAWQPVFAEAGRRVEIDSASVKKDAAGKVQTYGRVLFDKALPDATSGGAYTILEALNIYDCEKRTFATLKRIYRKDEKNLLREETSRSRVELPVRTGTLDEKILRTACRPGSDNGTFAATVSKAKAAAEVNAPEPRKELLRAELGSKRPAANDTQRTPAPAHAPTGAPAAKPGKATVAKTAENYDHVHWAYEGRGGPENWGKLSPENTLCASGTRQSPIDIRDGIGVDLPAITFSYRPSLFRLIDNGRTIQAGLSDNRISLLGKDYELIQLHFHRPSEERINGRNFDMVTHLVHKSYDGQLAVVAIMMERGSEHPLIQTLWNYLPLERNKDVFPPGITVDLGQILPEKREYFTYMGSLTTPPCTEGVLWLVMQKPIQVSAEQIGIFSRLYPNNARPIQPQSGRLIKESR